MPAVVVPPDVAGQYGGHLAQKAILFVLGQSILTANAWPTASEPRGVAASGRSGGFCPTVTIPARIDLDLGVTGGTRR